MSKKLYLNPPEGRKLSGKPVPKTDFDALRAYAHSLVAPDEVQYHSDIDDMTKAELVAFFETDGYTWTDLESSNWLNKQAAE
jgi:hypothetical protein